jgi:hypothetical protein
MVVEQPPLRRHERIEIYRYAYHARLLSALKSDFVRVAAILGEGGFGELTKDYVTKFPSESPNLCDLGSRFPEFLKTHKLSKTYPWLSDLAHFEWRVAVCFWAPNVSSLDVSKLAALRPEQWPKLRIILAPWVQLIETQWPVMELWEAALEGPVLVDKTVEWKPGRYVGVLHRLGFKVLRHRLTDAQFAVLKQVSQGELLGDLDLADPSVDFGTCFADWTGRQFFSDIEV